MNKCGCGRSPTGFCIGWHNLTKEEYDAKILESVDVTEQETEAFIEIEKKNKK